MSEIQSSKSNLGKSPCMEYLYLNAVLRCTFININDPRNSINAIISNISEEEFKFFMKILIIIRAIEKTNRVKYIFTKKLYPEFVLQTEFLNEMNNGICDRTTTCPNINQGQKKENMQEGIKFEKQSNRLEDQTSRGTPARSKFVEGKSKFSDWC